MNKVHFIFFALLFSLVKSQYPVDVCENNGTHTYLSFNIDASPFLYDWDGDAFLNGIQDAYDNYVRLRVRDEMGTVIFTLNNGNQPNYLCDDVEGTGATIVESSTDFDVIRNFNFVEVDGHIIVRLIDCINVTSITGIGRNFTINHYGNLGSDGSTIFTSEQGVGIPMGSVQWHFSTDQGDFFQGDDPKVLDVWGNSTVNGLGDTPLENTNIFNVDNVDVMYTFVDFQAVGDLRCMIHFHAQVETEERAQELAEMMNNPSDLVIYTAMLERIPAELTNTWVNAVGPACTSGDPNQFNSCSSITVCDPQQLAFSEFSRPNPELTFCTEQDFAGDPCRSMNLGAPLCNADGSCPLNQAQYICADESCGEQGVDCTAQVGTTDGDCGPQVCSLGTCMPNVCALGTNCMNGACVAPVMTSSDTDTNSGNQNNVAAGSSNSGLTDGGIAGIVIAVVACFIISIVAAVFGAFWYAKRSGSGGHLESELPQ